jgi:hypothetical protein
MAGMTGQKCRPLASQDDAKRKIEEAKKLLPDG